MTAAFLFKRVGDSLMATPALRALRFARPAEEIVVICEPSTARVFAGNPHVDRVLTLRSSSSLSALLSMVRTLRPTHTVDFLSNPRTALSSWLSGARDRAGIGYGLRRLLYSRVVAVQDPRRPFYSALHKLKLAGATEISSCAIEFFLTAADREFAEEVWQRHSFQTERVAAFFVNSRRTYKRWPVERYAEVIRFARTELGLCPAVLETPGDETSVSMLREHLGASAVQVIRVDDLGRLAALLARSALLVGNDGGPKHLAVAMGTPTLTLFGTEPWEYWTPPNDPRHRVVTSTQTEFATSPLEHVTVEQVTQQLRALLEDVVTA